MSEGATPVPIPNTVVKPFSVDDSRKAKVGRRLDIAFSFLLQKRGKICCSPPFIFLCLLAIM